MTHATALFTMERRCVCFLLCLMCCIILYILFKIVEFPYFFFSDQHEHLLTIGGYSNFFNYPIGVGRFFPLNKVEFYPILTSGLPLESMMQGVYWIQALKVGIFFIFFFLALKELSSYSVAILLSFIFIAFAPFVSLYQTLTSTIFPDVCSIMSVSMFIYFYAKGLRSDSFLFFSMALLCSVVATYYKEPVFIVFVVFGFMRLVFFQAITVKEKILICTLFLNGAVFLALYFTLAYGTGNYADGRTNVSWAHLALTLPAKMPFIACMYLLFLVRFISLFFYKSKLILADILLCMSFVYTASIIYLCLDARYYFIFPYVLFFFSIAAYSVILNNWLLLCVERYSISLDIICRYRKYTVAVIVLLSLICIFIGINKFDFYVKDKIYTVALTETLVGLSNKGFPYVAYLPDAEKFSRPFLHSASHWYLYTVNSFYTAAMQRVGEIKVPAFNRADDFLVEVDAGRIGQFAPVETKESFPWRNNVDYKELDFGFTSFVYNIKHEKMIREVYCTFAKKVAAFAGDGFEQKYENIYEDAIRLDCRVSSK